MRWLSMILRKRFAFAARPGKPGLALVLLLVACNRGDKDLEAKYKQARDSVSIGDPWSTATKQLEEMLGPPQQKEPLEWRWAVVKSGFCYDVRVMKSENADKVKGLMGGAVNSAVADRYERCKAVATGEK